MKIPRGDCAAWPATVADGQSGSRWSSDPLAGLRIGCVKYLNAQPLIYGYRGPVIFEHPSALARDLAAGLLDVALVPTFEALRGGRYFVVEGVSIASDGPVFSVFLAHRGPLEKVRTITLDPASLTSVHLLKVLLVEGWGIQPQCVPAGPGQGAAEARLLIGNQAIDFRQGNTAGWSFLDLGEEWKRQTGLPFVYAPWLLRADLPRPDAVAKRLRQLGREGLARLEEVVARGTLQDAEFRRRYLTQHIQFGLGEREKAGIARFSDLLVKHGFLPPSTPALSYL